MILFKTGINQSDLFRLHPCVKIVLSYMELYAKQENIHGGIITVSSMMTDVVTEKRISKSHEEGRAVDVILHGWNKLHCERFKHFINKKYGASWGSRKIESYSRNQVCVYGDEDHLDHMHLQVRRGALLTGID